MGINPAIAFTTILLALMAGAGVVSASWGYRLGREALTGVRQPDSRPASSSAAAHRNTSSPGQAPMLRDEQAILQDVQARMSGGIADPSSTSTPSN